MSNVSRRYNGSLDLKLDVIGGTNYCKKVHGINMLKDELPHLLYNKKHAANKDCTLCLSAVQMVQ